MIELELGAATVVVRELAPADEPAVLALFEACEDWFVAATGLPAAPGDVQSLYYALPEGADFDDKVLLVVSVFGSVVGIVDAVRRYPDPASVSLGGFLIDPTFRRRGLGRLVASALIEAAREAGFTMIRTHTEQTLKPGRAFLAALGFEFEAPRVPGGDANRNPGPYEGKAVLPAVLRLH